MPHGFTFRRFVRFYVLIAVNSALHVCKQAKNFQLGKAVWDAHIAGGIRSDSIDEVTVTSYVSLLATCGEWDTGLEIIDELFPLSSRYV